MLDLSRTQQGGSVDASSIEMNPADLRARTKQFAVDAIRFAKRLPNDRITNRIIGQLTDSAGAVASGYRAVCRARSRADFIYKLGNAIEEADESALWLEILAETELGPRSETDPLWKRPMSSFVSSCAPAKRHALTGKRSVASRSMLPRPFCSQVVNHQSQTIH